MSFWRRRREFLRFYLTQTSKMSKFCIKKDPNVAKSTSKICQMEGQNMVLPLLTPRIRRPWVISLNQTPPRVFEIPLYFWQCRNYHNRRAARGCRTWKFPAHDQKRRKISVATTCSFSGCETFDLGTAQRPIQLKTSR